MERKLVIVMYDSASNWSMHCHIHTGEKPYHCTVCNNHTISTLDNVNLITRHLKVVPTLERTYIKYRSCYSFNNHEYFVNEDGITEITVILFCYYQAWARKRLLDLISLLTNVTVCIVCSSINMISGLVYMWPGLAVSHCTAARASQTDKLIWTDFPS